MNTYFLRLPVETVVAALIGGAAFSAVNKVWPSSVAWAVLVPCLLFQVTLFEVLGLEGRFKVPRPIISVLHSATLSTALAAVLAWVNMRSGFSPEWTQVLTFSWLALGVPWCGIAVTEALFWDRWRSVREKAARRLAFDIVLFVGVCAAAKIAVGDGVVVAELDGLGPRFIRIVSHSGERRIYGYGIDEVVRVEYDVDGNGSYECREDYRSPDRGTFWMRNKQWERSALGNCVPVEGRP
jgi:hypothetical protein